MMEPMNLGSPIGSPNNVVSSPTQPNSPYLPSFLMGEPSANTSRNRTLSPTKNPKHLLFQSTPVTPRPQASYSSPLIETQKNRQEQKLYAPGEKTGGPPIIDLFDTLSPPPTELQKYNPLAPNQTRFQQAENNFDETGRKETFAGLEISEQPSADTNWVTVFGFPSSASSFILSQFALCGNILGRKQPSQGNWMHLHFSCKMDCRKALNNNGKVFGGQLMVGVVPYRDLSMINRDKENSSFYHDSTMNVASPISSPRPYMSPNIRTLDYAFKKSQSDSMVVNQVNTPQKDPGMIGKVWDYVFGW